MQSTYLTTKELAELLRLKERKIYELAASGEVPSIRATGKLLFSRSAIDAWLKQNSFGPDLVDEQPRRDVFLGSHDPLLEWALRESACGCATFFDGSSDGLDRFEKREGAATGLHLYRAADGDWNRHQVESRFARESVVLVEFCWRERGLIVAPGNPRHIDGLDSLPGRRIVKRQRAAGSQLLLTQLLAAADLDDGDLQFCTTARTETDAALAVLDGKADAAFGLLGVAQQFRLGFVPVIRERFDLLVERRAWFGAAMQKFLRFCECTTFQEKARSLGGYDARGFGDVHFNS